MHEAYDQLPPETAGDTSRACLAGGKRETKETACGNQEAESEAVEAVEAKAPVANRRLQVRYSEQVLDVALLENFVSRLLARGGVSSVI